MSEKLYQAIVAAEIAAEELPELMEALESYIPEAGKEERDGMRDGLAKLAQAIKTLMEAE